jgi:folate-dependent phosphoribosylglycinamide formyltransferase PurN
LEFTQQLTQIICYIQFLNNMRIVLYTSEKTDVINLYNISCLMRFYPDFQYKIIRVKSKPQQKRSSIRNILSRIKNGPNYFLKDHKVIMDSIKEITPSINFDEFTSIIVDKVNDSNSEKIISEYNPDIILQCGAGILKKNIFLIPKLGTINIHHGFAPEIRGVQSTFWAMYYGLYDKIGVSCHFIDEKIDTGIIISQHNYSLKSKDTFIDVQQALIKIGADLLINSISKIQKKNFSKTKEVKSYYFSNVDFKKYKKFKKMSYRAVETNASLKFKNLPKTSLIL